MSKWIFGLKCSFRQNWIVRTMLRWVLIRWWLVTLLASHLVLIPILRCSRKRLIRSISRLNKHSPWSTSSNYSYAWCIRVWWIDWMGVWIKIHLGLLKAVLMLLMLRWNQIWSMMIRLFMNFFILLSWSMTPIWILIVIILKLIHFWGIMPSFKLMFVFVLRARRIYLFFFKILMRSLQFTLLRFLFLK